MYISTGQLHYSLGAYHRLVVNIDPEIGRYYRSLFPKYVQINSPLYPAHISVVRHEIVPNLSLWGKYEGEPIVFCYDGAIHSNGTYYWLDCFCRRLEEIRQELGLVVESLYTTPPEGFLKVWHTTLGNTKGRL